MKYNQEIDTTKNPCPHPADYCQFRDGCIINRLCMERTDCREMKKAAPTRD
ncbi:MAG: hypothetical protein L7F78_09860 [Syntrophales bacterium LBB04]|nr:hypothetical protein [Syntrophales bacterium LBB04]